MSGITFADVCARVLVGSIAIIAAALAVVSIAFAVRAVADADESDARVGCVGSVGPYGREVPDTYVCVPLVPSSATDTDLVRTLPPLTDKPDIPDKGLVDAGFQGDPACRLRKREPTDPTRERPRPHLDDAAALIEERAAIREFDGGLTRSDAERAAAAEVAVAMAGSSELVDDDARGAS